MTSLRGFAAVFVFLFHLNSVGIISFAPAKLGYSGVAFFFVLSGFLLAWTDRQGQGAPRFYLRRFARIYPSHLVVMLVALCLPTGVGESGPLPTLMNVILVQAWAPDFAYAYSVNGVAWSLSCEVFFYLLFPFIVTALRGLSARTLAMAGFGLFAVVSCAVLTTTMFDAGPAVEAIRYTNPLVRLPEFVLGVCAALAMRSGWVPRLWHGAALLAVAGIGFVVVSDKPAGDVWGTLIFLAVIVGAAQADCTRPIRIMQAKPLIYAGEVSFGFYLVHQLVIVHSVHLLGTGATVGIMAFIASVLCAVALHHGVERPANKALLVRFGKRQAHRR